MYVLLEFWQKIMAIPIMSPLSWFMISNVESGFHHEEGFKEQAVDLVHTFNEFRNPFFLKTSVSCWLDTRNVKDQQFMKLVKNNMPNITKMC